MFLSFLVPFVTAPFNDCLCPISHADNAPRNWSDVLIIHYRLTTWICLMDLSQSSHEFVLIITFYILSSLKMDK